jgi:hypothetical protein
MSDPITMAMVGAAVGGGGSLLKGKSLGKSLKNAAIGGTLGYGGGLASQGLLGAGAAGGAGTTASLAPEALAGTIESSGMIFNPATGSYLAPEAYLGASSSTPLFTGTGSILDKASMGAQSLGSNFSNPFSGGMGVDNLMGAAKMAGMYQPTQVSPAPSGRIEVGQAPSPEGLAAFIKQYYPQYQQPRNIDLGLG